MSALPLPLHPPFLTHFTLEPLGNYPDVLLLDARFDADFFEESLFDRLHIAVPERMQRAVRKRRAEFLASRYCLQQAMRTFGIEQFVLDNDASRAPLWPADIRGSLSHTQSWTGALLTRRSDLLPGIDGERIMSEERARDIAHLIVSPAETLLMAQRDLPFASALTAVFSMKESLYKAIWPRLRQFMDFSAAEVVDWDKESQRAVLRLTKTLSAEFYAGREFIAQIALRPDRVLTWVIGQQHQ